LLIDDHFRNASLALEGRLNGSPARASERTVGARRRILHLGHRGRRRHYRQYNCQNESRLESHPIAPSILN